MAKRSRETSFSPPADELSASDTYENLSDVELGRANKYKLVDNSPAASSISIMQCSLPPHQDSLQFQSHDDYEVHYLKEHTNRCSSCGKNFPTAHLLGLHIEENHNALRETLQAKGEKTYACFVEDCERKCSTPQKRRLHLIDKHGFPKFYNFRIVDNGIDRVASLLRDGQKRRVSLSTEANQSIGHRRRASSQVPAPMQANNASTISVGSTLVTQSKAPPPEGAVDDPSQGDPPTSVISEATKASSPSAVSDDMSNLEKSMSALRFVPTSVVLRNSKKS